MPRVIHLRRPPTIHVLDEPFVPEGMTIAEVDRRWAALRARNPAYFDGGIHHVLGVHRNGHGGAVVHTIPCAYRFHAVQGEELDLGVRSLGTKGIVERDGRYLLGLRSPNVAHYPETWEFAPGGVVDFGNSPEQTIVEELREECGMDAEAEPVAVAMIFDDILRTWEIVYRLRAGGEARPTDEYPQISWYTERDLPTPLSPLARQMIPLLA